MYISTEGTEEEAVTEFYDKLYNVVDRITETRDRFIIMGDWNASGSKDTED